MTKLLPDNVWVGFFFPNPEQNSFSKQDKPQNFLSTVAVLGFWGQAGSAGPKHKAKVLSIRFFRKGLFYLQNSFQEIWGCFDTE